MLRELLDLWRLNLERGIRERLHNSRESPCRASWWLVLIVPGEDRSRNQPLEQTVATPSDEARDDVELNDRAGSRQAILQVIVI